MARHIPLKSDDGLTKVGYVGFSWTLSFFGILVPLFRKDFKWATIYFVIALITKAGIKGAAEDPALLAIAAIGLLIHVYLAFTYNKIYTKGLIAKGYKLTGTDTEIAMNQAALGII